MARRTRLTLRERIFPIKEFKIAVAPLKAQLKANNSAIANARKAIIRRRRKLRKAQQHLGHVERLKAEINAAVKAGRSVMPWRKEDDKLLERARAAVETQKQRIAARNQTLAELQREREAIQKEIGLLEKRYYGAPLESSIKKSKNQLIE